MPQEREPNPKSKGKSLEEQTLADRFLTFDLVEGLTEEEYEKDLRLLEKKLREKGLQEGRIKLILDHGKASKRHFFSEK